MLPLGRVCKQPLRSLTRICQNSKFKIAFKGIKGIKGIRGTEAFVGFCERWE